MSYGNMLSAFSGDFVSVAYYQALSGFDSGPGAPQQPSTKRGVLQCIERRIREADGTLRTVREMKFWSRAVLTAGWFIRTLHGGKGETGIVYRITRENGWFEEGGFAVYGLERVVGDDGNATLDPGMNVGTGSFA